MTQAEKLAGGIDAFIDLVGRATSWLALVLALVMGSNVLLRYGFSIGSIAMQELEWHIMVPICVFGISYALRHGEHVRVDVLFQYLSPRNKLRVDVLTAICGMLLAVLVIWLCIPYVWQSWIIGEESSNPGGIPWRYLIKAMIPSGFALYFAASLSAAIRATLAYRRA